MKLFLFTLIFLLNKAMYCQFENYKWKIVASTSSAGIYNTFAGASFIIDKYYYYGFGLGIDASGNSIYSNSFYRWDTSNWAQSPVKISNNLNISGRLGLFYFVLNGKAYIGGGIDKGSNGLSDFYEFDPLNISNPFTKLTSYPGGGIFHGFAFCLNGKGYVGGGVSNTNPNTDAKNEFYSYDPVNGWISLGLTGGTGTNTFNLRGSATFTIDTGLNAKGYVCFGASKNAAGNEVNSIFEFSPINNVWNKVILSPSSSFPSSRISSTGFTLNNKYGIVVGGGLWGTTTYDDAYAFNPTNKSWTKLNSLGYAPTLLSSRTSMVSASDPFSNTGYIAGGGDYTSTKFYSEIIKFNLEKENISNSVLSSIKEDKLYPNPTTGLLNIDLGILSDIEVYDMLFKIVYCKKKQIGNVILNLEELPKGQYYVKIVDGYKLGYSKVIIK